MVEGIDDEADDWKGVDGDAADGLEDDGVIEIEGSLDKG